LNERRFQQASLYSVAPQTRRRSAKIGKSTKRLPQWIVAVDVEGDFRNLARLVGGQLVGASSRKATPLLRSGESPKDRLLAKVEHCVESSI